MGLSEILGGGLGKVFKDIVGTFKLDPETKAKLEAELENHRFEIAKLEMDYDARLTEAASRNIVAEASSDGWLAKNARPLFLFMGGIVIWSNYIAALVASLANLYYVPVPIPEEIYWLYGSGFLGYVGARSWEKFNKFKIKK